MPPRVRVIMKLTGFDFPPERISGALQLAPSDTWVKGEVIGRSIRKHEVNGWALESCLSEEQDPEAHILHLAGLISPERILEVRASAQALELEFAVVIEMSDTTPPLGLSVDTIRRLSGLGASIDVDMYIVEEGAVGTPRDPM